MSYAEWLRPGEQQLPETTTDEEMIQNLRSYRRVKRELEEAEERARTYLRQVEFEVGRDLRSLREHVESLNRSMEIFIQEFHDGKAFKVPGLATAYVTKRTSVKVADEERFRGVVESSMQDRLDEVFPRKINKSKATELAKMELAQYGEILPGVEVEESQSLSVRLTGGQGEE